MQGTILGATSINIARVMLAVAAISCLWFVFVGTAEIMHEWNWNIPQQRQARQALAWGASFAIGLFAIPAALRLAPAVSRERQRHTLDSLLTLPIERSTLLWAKTRASIEPTWAWLALAIPAAGAAFFSMGNWFIGLLAIAMVTCGVYFLVCLGTLLTVTCSSEAKALRFLLPAVVVVVGMPAATFSFVNWRHTADMSLAFSSLAAIMFIIGGLSWRRATLLLRG